MDRPLLASVISSQKSKTLPPLKNNRNVHLWCCAVITWHVEWQVPVDPGKTDPHPKALLRIRRASYVMFLMKKNIGTISPTELLAVKVARLRHVTSLAGFDARLTAVVAASQCD